VTRPAAQRHDSSLALAAPRSGPTPNRAASNATVVSRTDPEAKLRYKPGHRPHLVYRAQVATDPKARVIVAVLAEPASGHEADSLSIIIDRSKWLRHKVAEIVADAGYASDAVYTDLAQRRIDAFIAPQPNMLKRAGGQAARKRCRSPRGRDAAIDRITRGEGAIAELKRHGTDRARCRGTAKLQIQLLLAATAIDLKRLTTYPPAAETPTPATRPPSAHTWRSSTPAYTPSPPTRARLLRRAPRAAPQGLGFTTKPRGDPFSPAQSRRRHAAVRHTGAWLKPMRVELISELHPEPRGNTNV
jgi:hypothetical protein